MEIRKANLNDVDEIMRIYAAAKAFMIETGNKSQWVNGYPQRELIESDIAKGVDRGLHHHVGKVKDSILHTHWHANVENVAHRKAIKAQATRRKVKCSLLSEKVNEHQSGGKIL